MRLDKLAGLLINFPSFLEQALCPYVALDAQQYH
jgi:hypothetical protein